MDEIPNWDEMTDAEAHAYLMLRVLDIDMLLWFTKLIVRGRNAKP